MKSLLLQWLLPLRLLKLLLLPLLTLPLWLLTLLLPLLALLPMLLLPLLPSKPVALQEKSHLRVAFFLLEWLCTDGASCTFLHHGLDLDHGS
ncbi:hypothetical protein HUU62_22950 [Rhodoferax sp. 4810]|nr:hypothetical protein [Rhodoferax jenense]